MAQLSEPTLDLANCDREPIHIPGSIQPHGVLLVADARYFKICQVAGDTVGFLGRSVADCLDRTIADILGSQSDHVIRAFTGTTSTRNYLGAIQARNGRALDLVAHRQGGILILELEPVPPARRAAADTLAAIEEAAHAFENAPTLHDLCDRAAREMRRLTGFDRVMIYRFREDGVGWVFAEDRASGLSPFLNHHYPASDIPRQARALYLRNVIRVIPDVHYTPAPLLPPVLETTGEKLDMSDCVLRSVSPIHVQYLKNMGVAASMSVSLVREGELWGLIACHHRTSKPMPFEIRSICRVLAGILSQQIVAKEQAELYEERVRLREAEDELLRILARAGSVDTELAKHRGDLLRAIPADGVAFCHGRAVAMAGRCPMESQIRALVDWLHAHAGADPYATDTLSRRDAAAGAYTATASGLLSIFLSRREPCAILWFRAEEVEVVKWGGNPHKPVEPGSDLGTLNPRRSFELWEETVRGRARAWSRAETEAAGRLRNALQDLRRRQKLRELNTQLRSTLADKESLLTQKDFLLREVDHRVQNSLQIVSSLLSLQMRATADLNAREQLDAARRRLLAVALVHRRLYRSDQLRTIALDRYLRELRDDFVQSIGPEWNELIRVHAPPVSIPTDRVVSLALVISELVTNAVKYAYGGNAGPIDVTVEEEGPRSVRIIVADHGSGRGEMRHEGFGAKLIDALVQTSKGHIEILDNKPGTCAVISLPIA